MSKRKPAQKAVHLTNRTLQDLLSIEEYSIMTWGKRVANRYLGQIEAALQRLADNAEILRPEPNLHESLYFYRVNQHLLVCDVQSDAIFVLTVLHAGIWIFQNGLTNWNPRSNLKSKCSINSCNDPKSDLGKSWLQFACLAVGAGR